MEMYEVSVKEKDEMKIKAMTILKRVKELEQQQADHEIIKNKLISIENKNSENVKHLENDIMKYKSAMEKV